MTTEEPRSEDAATAAGPPPPVHQDPPPTQPLHTDEAPATDHQVVDPAGETPAPPRHGGSLPALIAAAVVLIALTLAAVLLGVRDHQHRDRNAAGPAASPAQQAVLAAARQEAVALTSIGYRTADQDLDRVLAGATGPLRTQFEKEKAQLPATLAQNKSTSRGTVLSAALSSLTSDTAQALVALDANVSGTDTGASGVLKHYRMVVSLHHVDGHWLASDVAFAGVPQ